MAGDWIPIRTDLHRDPAVIGIAADLATSEREVVGALVIAWSWATEQLRDGHASSVTKSFLDRYIGVTGFCDAVAKHGWLRVTADAITFPNWDRWLCKGAKVRLQSRDRKRQSRSRKGHASSVTKSGPKDRTGQDLTSDPKGSDAPKPRKPAQPKVPAETWITPYCEDFEGLMGGIPRAKLLAAVIGPVRAKAVEGYDGDKSRADGAVRHCWRRFLREECLGHTKYNLHKFTETYRQYAGPATGTSPRGQNLTAAEKTELAIAESNRIRQQQAEDGKVVDITDYQRPKAEEA